MKQTKANTTGRRIGAYVAWEPEERHAVYLSSNSNVGWGHAGIIVENGCSSNGSSWVRVVGINDVFVCRTTDLRVITEREYATCLAEKLLS